ncbi:MAG: hypothetical protein EXS63_00515 [Candidatus Omnitrophica bacterium]|nr:hypothetical protein [Candidatus Omnitrophota bacterium]
MKSGKRETILERFMLKSPEWQEGYSAFNELFGSSLGWVYLIDEFSEDRLIRLDRKDHCSFYAASESNQRSIEDFLKKFCGIYALDSNYVDKFPLFFKDAFGRHCLIFSLTHVGNLKGFLLLTSLHGPQRKFEFFIKPLNFFLAAQVDLAFRTFELNNFYETVHPRALALSTMHSVHRVISTSLRLNELLPRIARLSTQVLKAKGCSIMLCDAEHEYLLPFFSTLPHPRLVPKHRLKIGRGIPGRIAKTGEFHFNRNAIAVPFIEDDVVGTIALWDKIGRLPFTKTDLEILKSLSEQTVVAIKNAQLYEETEQLTLGSIKAISELLASNISRHPLEFPLMVDLIKEVGLELALPPKDLIILERAVMLLDAGVLLSPGSFWKKKGKLTKREFNMIKQIPIRGANLLRSMKSLRPYIPILTHYRERYDGKGYPQGLRGDEIPIGARIIAVIDSLVAMISHRAYRVSLSVEAAIEEIKVNRGTQFDPHVVDCFLSVIRRFHMMEKIKAIRNQKKQLEGAI